LTNPQDSSTTMADAAHCCFLSLSALTNQS
jgi:hypothetical protein